MVTLVEGGSGILDAKTKTIAIAPGQGTQLDYSSVGWRAAEIIQQKSGKTIRKDISYCAQGWVKSSTNHVDETDDYTYDKAGRRTDYVLTDDHGKKTIHYTRYNQNGWIEEQGQQEQKPLSASPMPLVQTQFTDFYPDGQAQKQDTFYYSSKKSGQKTLHDDMHLHYVGFDRWQLVQNEGTRYRYDSKKSTPRSAVTVTFDANSYPQSIDGDLQGHEGFRWFQVNPEGRIVVKENVKGQELYIYGPRGEVIGWVGDLQSDPTSIDVPSKVNFDPTFHFVTRNWPPAMPGQYVAQTGDTFNSISRLLYGDPSFAYLIAQTNGYAPGDSAPVGAVLKVPQVTLTGEHNRAGQFAPYNPGALIGSLYPDMPIPPPPARHFLAMLLEIIVSAVITILLSPTGSGAAAGTMWLVKILEDAAIYAGISGLSDVATQMIGMAFGSQEKFSWHEFGNALETGAMSGALGGALAQLGRLNGLSFIGKGFKQAKGADVNWTEVGAKLFDNEVLTISGELASMALGQQKRFSWLDVFNSALQTGAGEVLAKEGLSDDKGFKGFMSDVASSEIDAAISAEVYHDRFDPVLAFAHAVGTYAGEHLKHAWHGHLHNKGQGQNTHKVSHQVRQQGMGAGAVQLPPPADTASPYLPKHTTGPQGGHEPDPLDTPIVNDDGTLAQTSKGRGNNNISLWHRGSTGHTEGMTESQQFKYWMHQDAQADAQAHTAVKHRISQHLAQQNSDKAGQALYLLWAITHHQGGLKVRMLEEEILEQRVFERRMKKEDILLRQILEQSISLEKVHKNSHSLLQDLKNIGPYLLSGIHEDANVLRKYVQRPLLQYLSVMFGGISDVSEKLFPIVINFPDGPIFGEIDEGFGLASWRLAGFFKLGLRNSRLEEEGAETPLNYAAHNSADALRLNTTLSLQDAGILDQAGRLTSTAVDRSAVIMSDGSVLNNQSVINVLTKNGSNIVDWQKLTTESVELSNGQRIQVHFYRNKITGEINYIHPDFKVKNPINLFPKQPQQEPTITPPYKP